MKQIIFCALALIMMAHSTEIHYHYHLNGDFSMLPRSLMHHKMGSRQLSGEQTACEIQASIDHSNCVTIAKKKQSDLASKKADLLNCATIYHHTLQTCPEV